MSLSGIGILKIQNLSRMFLKPKDLYTLRANGLKYKAGHSTLVPFKTEKRYNGTTKITCH